MAKIWKAGVPSLEVLGQSKMKLFLGKSPKRGKSGHGILLTEKQFKDFTVKANFRVNSGDSGFYFRCDPVKGGVSVHGFQVEVDYSQETGGLYETGGPRFGVVQAQ